MEPVPEARVRRAMSHTPSTAPVVEILNEQVHITVSDGAQIALSADDARRLARSLSDAAEAIEGSEIYQKPLG